MFENPDSVTAAVRINAGNFENSPLHRALYYSGSNYTGGGHVDLWIPVKYNTLITDTDTSDIVFGNGLVEVIEGINRKIGSPHHFTNLISEMIELHTASIPVKELEDVYIKINYNQTTKDTILDKKDPSYSIYKEIREDLPEVHFNTSMNRRTPYSSKDNEVYIPLDTRYKDIPEFNNIYSRNPSFGYKVHCLYNAGPGFLRLFNPKIKLEFDYRGSGNNQNGNKEQIDFINEHLPIIRDIAKSGKSINCITVTPYHLHRNPNYAIKIQESEKFEHKSYCSEYGLVFDSKEDAIVYDPRKVKARITYYTKGKGNLKVKEVIEEKQLSKDKLYTIMHNVNSVGNKLFLNIFIPSEGWNAKAIFQGNLESLLSTRPEVSIKQAIKEFPENYYHQELYGITCYCDLKNLHKRYLKDKSLFKDMQAAHKKFHKLTLGHIAYYERVILQRHIVSQHLMGIWWIFKSIEANKIIKLDIDQFHADLAKSYKDHLLLVEQKKIKKEQIAKRKTEKANRILAAAQAISNQKKEEIKNAS